ncbi:hypothetical protein DEU56DRAFT_769645 [Suillus clintonianus]|uniref:uncharacterized protein n=1 Tax=Suillus clintonianus TaxID=1904413 RepID=UPI001B87A569|nr:uncharacterized protein DEU56DRAFT_769645 [Suillus clintonianus]KAG2154661.1 hypothetical protein DEU56DRAFT_769645 [Suillus clintonianus]
MPDTRTSLPPFLDSLAPDSSVSYMNALFPSSDDIPSVHVHWWPCKRASVSPSTILLFIPGNPGIIDFYHPFLTAIHNQDRSGTLAILSHSHIGHDPATEDLAPARRTSFNHALTFQIRNSLRIFDALTTSFGVNTRIVIAGHSVGSWVALQVLKLRSAAVSGVFFLFPTITNIAYTPNGRLLSRLFRPPFPRITSQVARVLRLVPLIILRQIFPQYPISQLKVLRSFLLSPSSIFAAMTMAHDEMLNIKELDAATLDKYRHQLWFYFADHDDWVDQGRETILQVFRADPGTVKVVHGHRDIPHAFCINNSEEVALECYEWLVSGGFV